MRIRVRKPVDRYRALHMWHNWFAWHPVRVPTNGNMSGMTMVWMETIERKGKFYSYGMEGAWDWKYRNL